MASHPVFRNALSFAKHLRRLHSKRRTSMKSRLASRGKRARLGAASRLALLEKTGHRCHLCGGGIESGESWCADHVLAFAHGGQHGIDNYLPAHGLCNNYRWHYDPEEFQWILKLGVWLRSRIEMEDAQALDLAERFVRYEAVRNSRRVSAGEER